MTEVKSRNNETISSVADDSEKYLESVGAYALLGWLIGTFVPLAGGVMMYIGSLSAPDPPQSSGEYNLAGIFVIIVVLCSGTGAIGGVLIGGLMIFARRLNFSVPIIAAPIFGLIWGLVTGGVGGFPMFVIGGIIGAIIAAPVGAFGFLLFAAVYETLARRGGGILGWRKTLLAAVGTLLLTMIGGTVLLLIFNR